MEQKERILIRNKNLFAFILFTVFWSSFVILSGTISSGFHFQDDHEVITINKRINDNGLINASKLILKEDLITRFRPFYYLHRIALVEIFGTNFMLWSIYNTLLAILTSFFLYLFLFKQGYRFVNAFLFPFLALIGAQSAIWWRLGPTETIGFFLLSASLFFMVNSIVNGKRYQLIISIICLILSSLSKESFPLVIPAYLLFFAWIKWQRQPNENIFRIVLNNIIVLTIFIIILLGLAYIIIFVVGTGGPGYGGVDSSVSIGAYLTSIYSHLRKNEYTDLTILGLFFLLQNVKSWTITPDIFKKKLMPYLFNTLILISIILPQFIFYYKTGLWERYLLPLNLGFAFFVIYLSERVSISAETSMVTKRTYIILIIVAILWFFKSEAIPNAKLFAIDGKSTNKFLSSIIENSKADDPILIVLNAPKNYEHAFSIQAYLTIGNNLRNLKFFNIEAQSNDESEKDLTLRLSRSFDTLMVKEQDNHYNCIAILPFPNNEEIKSRIDTNNMYQRSDFNTYTVFIKRDSNSGHSK